MKFSIVAGALALATAVSAWEPYPCTLTQEMANEIVGGFSSLLQNKTYNGKLPADYLDDFLSPDYVEYSDSILALISKNNTVCQSYDHYTSTERLVLMLTALSVRH